LQHILPSPHYHEFCKRWAKPPMQPHVVTGHCFIIFSASSRQPAQARRSTMQV
jgi:hypothetical protein